MVQMRRQSIVQYAAPLCETIVDAPIPTGHEVLLRIERCGLCHSDLHIHDGYFDLGGGRKADISAGRRLPFTLGHEIAGKVEAIGSEVPKELVGARRAVFPWIGCGRCQECLVGDENLCGNPRYLGVNTDGGFASHVLVPDAKYLLDYGQLPINFAATLMCSGVTAYGALKRLVDRPRQRNLLLIGLGGVGMMGLSLAKAMFKQPISVVDLSASAREAALGAGAANAYDPTADGVTKQILKESDGGYDGVVDFAGNEKSMAFGTAALARGGKLVVSGMMGGTFTLPVLQWTNKRITVEGFITGTLSEAMELMELARAGRVAVPPMIEKPMTETQAWIDALRAGKIVGRVMLTN